VSNFNPRMSCYVQLLKSEDRDILKGVTLDFVVCLDEMKTIVQARNCVCPGFSTLVENLFHTFGQSLKEQVGNRSYLSDKLLWQQMYVKGASKEFYAVPLSLVYIEACSFEWSLVAEGIFLMFDSIVVGAYNSQTGEVLINPNRRDLKKYRYMSKFFEKFDAVIVIADERSQVSRIEANLGDRASIQKCLKKICIAEDYFAVRRALPSKFREGSKFVRNKVTIREITRIVKGYGKQLPLVGCDVKPVAKEAKVSGTDSESSFMGFLTDKSKVWNTLKTGAIKTANAMTLLGKPHAVKHLSVADEINERRKEGTWIDEEMYDDELEESKLDPNSGTRSRTQSMTSPDRPPRTANAHLNKDNIIQSKISDASSIRNHVVVFGYTKNVHHFINELRRPVLSNSDRHPIVVVSEELPLLWDSIAEEFSDVYFLSGTLSNSSTFNKTNIKYAHSIILLSGRDNVTKVEEEYLDADTLFMYMKLEKHIPRYVFFGVELTCASNMAVLNSSVIRQVSEADKISALSNTQAKALNSTANSSKAALAIGPSSSSSGVNDFSAVHEFSLRVNFTGKDVTSFRGSFSNFKTLTPDEPQATSTDNKESKGGATVATGGVPSIDGQLISDVLKKPDGSNEAMASNVVKDIAPIIDDTFWTIDETINILPVFASGNAYVPVSFDSLLVQSFYDSFVPRLCESIVCGTNSQTMRQVPVPKPFVGFYFLDLYRAMLSRYVLIMAIYRGPDHTEGNVLPYVYTAPPPECVLRENDKLFVFGVSNEIDECIASIDVVQLNDREMTLRNPLAAFLVSSNPGAATATSTSSPSTHAHGVKKPKSPEHNIVPLDITSSPESRRTARRGSGIVVVQATQGTLEV